MRKIITSPVSHDSFKLQGGVDLVTPTLSLRPGVMRDGLNFEANVTGGYSRIAGYVRFDGRPSPADAAYTAVTLSSVTGLVVGNTIQNPAGTVTGVVIVIDGLDVYYTRAVGAFAVGNTVQVGATVIGTVDALGGTAAGAYENVVYTAAAADVYRASIGAVPGSGPVRGLAYLNGVLYAWRNNAGGTAMAIYKSSATGWQAVSLGWELGFSGGTGTAIAVGDTVTGVTSGATGVVARVALESGSVWAAGTGRLILSSVTGNFGNAENLQVGGSTRAVTLTPGVQTQITLAPSGRVETVVANLGGATGAARIYGADGVNRGFEFDGTTYAPIRVTGLSPAIDKPTHVAVHRGYIYFSLGGSVQFSALALPFVWSAVLGAGEIVMPENITALQSLPSTDTAALLVVTRNNVSILYGATASSAVLISFDRGNGAAGWTVQQMGDTLMLDDKGVMALAVSQNFGNFQSSTLTSMLSPFLAANIGAATASGVSRFRSQYRVFFSGGWGLYLTIANGKMIGAVPVKFPTTVNVWCEGETSTETISFFGSGDEGYVYQMDQGPDFDGEGIEAWFVLNYNPQGNARVLKRYRRASVEMSGDGYIEFAFGYTLGYGSSALSQHTTRTYTTSFFRGGWDSFTWDNFIWDSMAEGPVELTCRGTAENIALMISSTSRYTAPFTVNSAVVHFSVRRGIR